VIRTETLKIVASFRNIPLSIVMQRSGA